MGLDVWFKDEIASALLAAEEASAATVAAIGGHDVADPAVLRAYRQGFRAALATVAIAFGIEPTRFPIDDGPPVIAHIPRDGRGEHSWM